MAEGGFFWYSAYEVLRAWAGLVKWHNGGFPNRSREFDSPIPQKLSSLIPR